MGKIQDARRKRIHDKISCRRKEYKVEYVVRKEDATKEEQEKIKKKKLRK